MMNPDDPLARCQHCGTPLERGVAFVTGGDGCGQLELPPHCPSDACRAARDEAAIERAIASGLIVDDRPS